MNKVEATDAPLLYCEVHDVAGHVSTEECYKPPAETPQAQLDRAKARIDAHWCDHCRRAGQHLLEEMGQAFLTIREKNELIDTLTASLRVAAQQATERQARLDMIAVYAQQTPS